MRPENFSHPDLPGTRPLTRTRLLEGLALALVAGLLFALGLVLSGMTQPAKVIGFLNLAGMTEGAFPGRWDPSLAFVMGGAVCVTLVAFWVTPANRSHPQRHPWFANHFELPAQERVDASLVLGAAIFGVGWGLSGYCPGPAIASVFTGGTDIAWFLPAMLVGMGLARMTMRR